MTRHLLVVLASLVVGCMGAQQLPAAQAADARWAEPVSGRAGAGLASIILPGFY